MPENITYSYCSLANQPNRTDLQHQQIKTSDVANNIYNCLNRLDENPFDKWNNQTADGNQEKWLNDVNTYCDEGIRYRRCLGDNSDSCVLDMRKHFNMNIHF